MTGRSLLLRSLAVAAWWSAHAWVTIWLLTLPLGQMSASTGAQEPLFAVAKMPGVLAYLGLPLHPFLVLALFFGTVLLLGLFACRLWRGALARLKAQALDEQVRNALWWSARKTLLSGWTLVLVGLTVAMLSLPGWVGITLMVASFLLLPMVMLRPRWLEANANTDTSWLPSGTAVLLYTAVLVSTSLFGFLPTGATDGWMTWIASLTMAVATIWLDWVAAGALLLVSRRQDIAGYVRSRLHHRFSLLVAIATVQPALLLIAWVLPHLLLHATFAFFVAPAVTHFQPLLAPNVASLYRGLLSAEDLLAEYWYFGAMPLWLIVSNLYMGRCLALFHASKIPCVDQPVDTRDKWARE